MNDACPACFPGDAPAAVPVSVHAEADGTITAAYRCRLCGMAWRTRWKVTSAWPESRDHRPVSALLDELIGVLADLLMSEETEAAHAAASSNAGTAATGCRPGSSSS